MTIPNKILIAGYQDEYIKGGNYEKTSTDNELVAGRIASRGTAAYQFKIWATGADAIGIFDKQISDPGMNSSNKYDENYAHDGNSVDVLIPADDSMIVYACLKVGETISVDDYLSVETGTGKLIAYAFGLIPVARAMEAASPSGSDKDDFKVRLLSNRQIDAAS